MCIRDRKSGELFACTDAVIGGRVAGDLVREGEQAVQLLQRKVERGEKVTHEKDLLCGGVKGSARPARADAEPQKESR